MKLQRKESKRFMKKLLESIKYWGQLFLLPIYWFSFFMPRDKHIWLFGSTFGRRFADNPRYFYLYLNQYRKDEIRAIWISHKKEIVKFLNNNGYEAYYFLSLKGIWYCLRGKVYLFDNYSKDINFWTSGGATKINLWHGIPLKKIQADNRFDEIRHPKTKRAKFKFFLRRISDEKPSHYVLATSKYLIPIFSSAFQTNHILTSGYPRNDALISNKIKNIYTEEEKKVLKKLQQWKKSKNNPIKQTRIVLYMPTFRESETRFFDVVSRQKLERFLKKNNIFFCIKLHPKSKLTEKFRQIQNKHIYLLYTDVDPYTFLNKIDVLVTDYSSIYFDFLLLKKPVIFFQYDFEEYVNNSRELYFNYQKATPGEKVSTLEELEAALLKSIESEKEYLESYETQNKQIKNKVFHKHNGLACLELMKSINQDLREN